MKILLVGDDMEISRMCNKIEDDPCNPRYILTVWRIRDKLGVIE